jgi:hypothetical protein
MVQGITAAGSTDPDSDALVISRDRDSARHFGRALDIFYAICGTRIALKIIDPVISHTFSIYSYFGHLNLSLLKIVPVLQCPLLQPMNSDIQQVCNTGEHGNGSGRMMTPTDPKP